MPSGDEVPEETRNPMSDIIDEGPGVARKREIADKLVPESLENSESSDEIQAWRETLVEHVVAKKENERDRRKRVAQAQLESSNLIDPEGKFRRRWDVLQMVLLVYVAILVPLRLGFEIEVPWLSAGFWVEFLVDVYFVSDIFVSFRSAYWDSRGELEVRPQAIKQHYLKTWFAIDVSSCFPGAYIGYALDDQGGSSNTKTIKMLRMFRLLKLMRLARFNRLMKRYEEEFYALLTTFKLGKLILLMFFIGHWLCCLWYAAGHADSSRLDADGNVLLGWVRLEFDKCTAGSLGNGTDTWSDDDVWDLQVGTDCSESLSNAGTWGKYWTSFYWAMMTMTTVGYGDIVPETEYEIFTAILGMIIGGFVFGLIVGSLAELSKRANPTELLRQKSVARVGAMLHTGAANVITPDLARRVRAYYNNYYARRSGLDFFGFIVNLPVDLRDEMARQMHWIDGVSATGAEVFGLLHKVPFFTGLDSLSAIHICARMKVCMATPMIGSSGDDGRTNLIMEEGQPGEDMFIIIGGDGHGRTVVLEKDGEVLGKLGPGDFFGELAALMPPSMAEQRVRTRTAYAEYETQLGVLSHEDIMALQRERHQIAAKLVPYVNTVAAQFHVEGRQPGPLVSTLDAWPELKALDAKLDRVLDLMGEKGVAKYGTGLAS